MDKLCFSLCALDGRDSKRDGSGRDLLSLPEDLDLGSSRVSVNSSYHSGKSCNRSVDAFVVTSSSGVKTFVLAAESSAEFVRCVTGSTHNDDRQEVIALARDLVFDLSNHMDTHFLSRGPEETVPLECFQEVGP